MITNTKRNEHPRCGCRHCRRGAGTVAGQDVHNQTNRAIRRGAKLQLAALVNGYDKAALMHLLYDAPAPIDLMDTFDAFTVSTPYTD